jgi:RNA polymerase sigma-70 factor, ECF subfamily
MSLNPQLASHTSDDGDEALIARIREGDHEAFNVLYLRHHHALWQFAMRYVRSPEVAEDICQDVLLSVWTRRSALVIQSSLKAFLFGAIRNRALRHLRQAHLIGEIEQQEIAAHPEGSHSIDDHMSSLDVATTFDRILAELPEDRRRLLMLRWTYDLSYAEIAKVLGITEVNARAQVSRMRKVLQKVLKPLLED